jgi:NAD(P)-dependent dehydrogenase (short-subunit alcohol dehydrogenase family)
MSNRHWNSDQISDQKDRVVIITGANSGIGYEAARVLALKGARVVLACRNPQLAAEAVDLIQQEQPAADVSFMKLDLASLSSVRRFSEEFRQLLGRLDLLINNGGVMVPPFSRTEEGFELQFGTNHLGHFALTGLLLELLLKRDDSRIINISSIAHQTGRIDFDDLNWEQRKYNPWSAYGQSKLANLLFTYELQRKLEKAGATSIAVAAHPGWTGTNLQRTSGMARVLNPWLAMPVWKGTLPTLRAATAADINGGEFIGPHRRLQLRGFPVSVESNAASHDREVATRLWDVSEELTGVRYDFTF